MLPRPKERRQKGRMLDVFHPVGRAIMLASAAVLYAIVTRK